MCAINKTKLNWRGSVASILFSSWIQLNNFGCLLLMVIVLNTFERRQIIRCSPKYYQIKTALIWLEIVHHTFQVGIDTRSPVIWPTIFMNLNQIGRADVCCLYSLLKSSQTVTLTWMERMEKLKTYDRWKSTNTNDSFFRRTEFDQNDEILKEYPA